METVELKRCPFCGGEARRYYGNYDMHGVVCKKCGAKQYGYANQASATKAWNRRADDERNETKEVLKDIFNDLDFDCVDATDCVSGERVVDWDCIVNIFKRYGITEEDLYSND